MPGGSVGRGIQVVENKVVVRGHEGVMRRPCLNNMYDHSVILGEGLTKDEKSEGPVTRTFSVSKETAQDK
jgi:hypothetical protein